MDAPACTVWHVNAFNEYVRELDDDVSSIGTVMEEQMDDDDVDVPLLDHYRTHINHINRLLPNWQTVEVLSDGAARTLIVIPKASKLPSIVLHPVLYRALVSLSDSEAFADRLDIDHWHDEFTRVESNRFVQRLLRAFCSLPDDASKRTIELQFIGLMGIIASTLDTSVTSSVLKYGIGGLLADGNYGYRGITDCCLYNSDTGSMILKTEFKTNLTFPVGHVWHHGSRGAQLFGALYSENLVAPTLLLTQRQFKVFIESKDRKAIMAFPPNYDMAQIQRCQNSDFLKVLVICVMAARTPLSMQRELRMSPERATVHIAPSVPPTPKKRKRESASTTKPRTRSSTRATRNHPTPPSAPPTAKKRKRESTSTTKPRTRSSTRATRNHPTPMYRCSAANEPDMYRSIWILSGKELDDVATQLGESEDSEW